MASRETRNFSEYTYRILNDSPRSVTAYSFYPREESAIDILRINIPSEKTFFLQRPTEALKRGKLYSILFYSHAVRFYLRPFELSPEFIVEYGCTSESGNLVKELAIEHNENELIFPNSMLLEFKKNSLHVQEAGFSVQIYHQGSLIAHASVLKDNDEIWENREIYWLLRFIVHRNYRDRGGVKEFLMSELAKFIPNGSALSLQVFPQNSAAQRFFSRRINVVPFFEKWSVE